MSNVIQTIRSGGTQHPQEIINIFPTVAITTSGVVSTSDNHFLVEESDTPAMSVDVRQGYAYIQTSASDMAYPVWMHTADATVAISSNSSGNDRIDALVLYIDTGASPNTTVTNVAKLVVVEGTPAGSPTAPSNGDISTAIGASNPFIRLADIDVANGASSILDADITDQRSNAVLSSFVSPFPLDNNSGVTGKDTGGTARNMVKVNANDQIIIGENNVADHTIIEAGSSKLVKTKVLRQDNTSDSYKNNTVVLTGWGFIGGGGGRNINESVTFGITFSERPIITTAIIGRKDGSDPSHQGDITTGDVYAGCNPVSVATTGFTAVIFATDSGETLASGSRFMYTWVAIGQLN